MSTEMNELKKTIGETIEKMAVEKASLSKQLATTVEQLQTHIANETRLKAILEDVKKGRQTYFDENRKLKSIVDKLQATIAKDKKINASHLNAVYKEKNKQINDQKVRATIWMNACNKYRAECEKWRAKCAEWEDHYYDASKEAEDLYLQQRETYKERLSALGDKYIEKCIDFYEVIGEYHDVVDNLTTASQNYSKATKENDVLTKTINKHSMKNWVLLFVTFMILYMHISKYNICFWLSLWLIA